MKKAITVLLTIILIGLFLASSILSVQSAQNESSAWVLVEVIDIDAAESIASKTKEYEGIYHMTGSYSEGNFSISSAYVGPTDDYYNPPKINGESFTATASFSRPPQVIYPYDEISINISLSVVRNESFYTSYASVRAKIGKKDQSFSDFTNEKGEGSFKTSVDNNYASINENVTAVAPSGAEGDKLELLVYLYHSVRMETQYVYEWKEVDGAEPETEQPTATIGPTSTIGPTPTVCPANTEIEKYKYLIKLYTARIPKGKSSSGPLNNIRSVVNNDYKEFVCGGYQSKVLNFLNGLKFSKDPCERQLLDNWDYGPIQAWFGGHQAVVIFPKGTTWQSTGIVLDPWPDQTPKTYSANDWAIMFSLTQDNLAERVIGATFIGIGPSDVYRQGKEYPIYDGGNYIDTRMDKIEFTKEEFKFVQSLTSEKRAAFDKMSKPDQKRWLEHMMQGHDKSQKVIAHCPLSLFIIDQFGNRSGLSGTEILTELPDVEFLILELTDGTIYTEMTYPENAGYTLVLEGTDEGQAHVFLGHTLLLEEPRPPLQQYSFAVTKGETYQIATDSLGTPMQWDGGSLAPESVTEFSEGFLESLPGLLLPEALDPDNVENEIFENNDISENGSQNSSNIWIFLLCGLSILCFLLVVGLVIVFIVLRKKEKGNQ